MKGQWWKGACAVVLVMALAPIAAAQDEEAADESPWTGALGLAYVATSGNSDTQTFGLDFTLDREADPWGLALRARFTQSEEDSVTTAERYVAGIRGTRALGGRWTLFAGISGEQDEFAGYDLLLIGEVGVAYAVLTGPTHTLSFDAGLTWTDEDRVEPEPDVDYVGGVAGLAYAWALSDTASFTERLLWYPNFDDSSDWRLTSETALQAAISSRLALKLSYEVRYRNEPIGDNDDTDTTTKASLVVSF